MERHAVTRIRRETRRRQLRVADRERLSRSMLRLHFTSSELADFESIGFDDHLKLFVPDGIGGMVGRDYTPRRFDTASQTLAIDFALHQAGPATRWALAARPGDTVEIGGPRGSAVLADDFDWHLLIGDETALPAIGRLLEELRPGVPVTSVIAVDSEVDRVVLPSRDGATVHWAERSAAPGDDAARLMTHVRLAPGEGHVWIAAEASVARVVRAKVVEIGQPQAWLKASGYSTRGVAGADSKIGEPVPSPSSG